MDIIPYKQTLTHSCLVASFLMILKAQNKIDFTDADEQEVALKGSRRIYSSYMVGISSEIAKKYGKKIQIFADNKYFTKILQESFKDKKVTVTHHPITLDLIKKLLEQGPLICHIDDNALGDYSHASHFIVLVKATESMITIADPWTGKKKRISNKTLEEAIFKLKTHIKMCPLLFRIEP